MRNRTPYKRERGIWICSRTCAYCCTTCSITCTKYIHFVVNCQDSITSIITIDNYTLLKLASIFICNSNCMLARRKIGSSGSRLPIIPKISIWCGPAGYSSSRLAIFAILTSCSIFFSNLDTQGTSRLLDNDAAFRSRTSVGIGNRNIVRTSFYVGKIFGSCTVAPRICVARCSTGNSYIDCTGSVTVTKYVCYGVGNLDSAGWLLYISRICRSTTVLVGDRNRISSGSKVKKIFIRTSVAP